MDWLFQPLSGAATHHIAPWASWHARCMVLAWALLLPVGALVARFFKVRALDAWPARLDDKAWWHGHRALQWAGVLVMSMGVAIAWRHGQQASAVARLHAVLGWAVGAAGWLQIASGLLRGSKGGPTAAQERGDHFDMTPRRVAFERLHKGLGWGCLLAAIAVIALGLVAADAPRWMAAVLLLWWAALGLAFARLQRAGRCIDTYQAIWGPNPALPGNRIPPIGWGVRRP